MGVAGCIGNVLQPCGGGVTTEPSSGNPTCGVTHGPTPMTLVIGPFPPAWVGPYEVSWGDGLVEPGSDGEDAHEFALEGTYTITAHDSAGHTCSQSVEVPWT